MHVIFEEISLGLRSLASGILIYKSNHKDNDTKLNIISIDIKIQE